MSLVKVLGIKIEEENIKEIRGVGDARVPVIIKDVRMRIGEYVFDAKIAIALIEGVPYLLGEKMCSTNLRFVLSRKRKLYTLIQFHEFIYF